MEMEREKDNKRKMTKTSVLIGGMPGTRDSRDNNISAFT